VALRKAELLTEDLRVDKKDADYILGEHKGRTYQILVTYQDGIYSESSTDLPPLDYHDSSGSTVETPKSAIKEIRPSMTEEERSSDYWIVEEGGLLIRKHIVPRTNLYNPDFDHDPTKNTQIKEMRITHVQYVNGKGDVVCDQWAHHDNNQIMKKNVRVKPFSS